MSRPVVGNNGRLKRIVQNLAPVIVVGVFIILLSWKTLPWHGVIGYGDYPFYWPQGNFNGLSTWFSSYLGIAWTGLMFGTPILGLLPRILMGIGMSASWASYLLNYTPVFLFCLATFYFTRRVSQSTAFAYSASLFVVLNNFMLEQFIIWPGSYFWNALGILIAVYITWRISTHGISVRRALVLVFGSLLTLNALLWFLYVSYLFCFFLYRWIRNTGSRRRVVLEALGILTAIIAVSAYWLIPFGYNTLHQSAAEAYNGNLQSVLVGFKSIASYVNIFSLRQYYIASPHAPQYSFHTPLQTAIMFLLYILLAGTFLKRQFSRFMLFLVAVIVVYSNFALGPNSIVTGSLWTWMFNTIPAFGFFRSFTRVSIVTLIVMVMYFALYVRSHRNRTVIVASVTVAALSIIGFRMMFTGDLSGIMASERVPKEYEELNQTYFNRAESRYTIVTYPNVGYEATTWNINKNVDVFPQQSVFQQVFFSQPVAFNTFTVFLDQRNSLFKRLFPFYDKFSFTPAYNFEFSKLGARYVLIHKDLYNILQPGARVPYEQYLQYFSNNSRFVLRENNQYFSLYEYKDYRPIITGAHVQFQAVFDTMYRIRMTHVAHATVLKFLQNYNAQWNLYAVPPSQNDWCTPSLDHPAVLVTECHHVDQFFAGSNPLFLFKKSIFEESHTVANQYANKWTVDPAYIAAHLPSSMYTMNNDGTMNVEFVLFFRPQALFFIGVIVSCATGLGCIVWFLIHSLRRPRSGSSEDAV